MLFMLFFFFSKSWLFLKLLHVIWQCWWFVWDGICVRFCLLLLRAFRWVMFSLFGWALLVENLADYTLIQAQFWMVLGNKKPWKNTHSLEVQRMFLYFVFFAVLSLVVFSLTKTMKSTRLRLFYKLSGRVLLPFPLQRLRNQPLWECFSTQATKVTFRQRRKKTFDF